MEETKFIVITNNIKKMMLKRGNKTYRQQLTLPMLKIKHNNEHALKNYTVRHGQYTELPQLEENQATQLEAIDLWNKASSSKNKDPARRRKYRLNTNLSTTSMLSQFNSSRFSMGLKRLSKMDVFVEIQCFISTVDAELQKISDIPYELYHKNVEYCYTMYEDLYNTLFQRMQKFMDSLSEELLALEKDIEEEQDKYRALIEKKNQSDQKFKSIARDKENMVGNRKNSQRLNIQTDQSISKEYLNLMHEAIQRKKDQVEPRKNLLEVLKSVEIKILKHCFSLGYNTKEEGLLWVMHKLQEIPEIQEFPTFLNKVEMEFLVKRYRGLNDKFTNKNEEIGPHTNIIDLTRVYNKNSNQIYKLISTRKERQLSMINEIQDDFIEKKNQQLKRISNKYLSPEVQNMLSLHLKEHSPKSTTNQILYQETVKKLNKICLKEIYKNKDKNVMKDKENVLKKVSRGTAHRQSQAVGKRLSKNTKQLYQYFDTKISKYLQEEKQSEGQARKLVVKSQEERQLQQILKELRYEAYAMSTTNSMVKSRRNPISIICALVGYRKGKKILENQMNFLI